MWNNEKIRKHSKFQRHIGESKKKKKSYKAIIFSKLCKLNILSVNLSRKLKCARMLITSNNVNN